MKIDRFILTLKCMPWRWKGWVTSQGRPSSIKNMSTIIYVSNIDQEHVNHSSCLIPLLYQVLIKKKNIATKILMSIVGPLQFNSKFRARRCLIQFMNQMSMKNICLIINVSNVDQEHVHHNLRNKY